MRVGRLAAAVCLAAVLVALGFRHAPYDTAATLQAGLLVPVYAVKTVAAAAEMGYHVGYMLSAVAVGAASDIAASYSATQADNTQGAQDAAAANDDAPATSWSKLVAWSETVSLPNMDGTAVVITGASSGIGMDVALLAAERGASLLLAARRVDRLKDVARRCRERGAAAVHILKYDATKSGDARAMVDTATDRLGRIDVLVLNAGTAGPWSRIEDIPNLDVLHWLMEVNYWGYVRATHAALPHLKRTRGRLVVVSSFYGRIPAPFQAGYSATKHALHGFFDTLRPELAAHGVSITAHCPGGIKTEVQNKFLHAAGRDRHMTLDIPPLLLVSSRECAASILWAAYRRASEAYFPLYAGLASKTRQAFPEAFDPGFTWLVNYHMNQSTFSLRPTQ